MPSQKPPLLPRGDVDLWQRATKDVTPLGRPKLVQSLQKSPLKRRRPDPEVRLDDFSDAKALPRLQKQPLDKSWQKRLRRGRMAADRTIDLHGLTQHKAHALLLQTLENSLRQGERILLVVTGKGKSKTSASVSSNGPRGVLRRLVPQWVEASAYAGQVIAIRTAHATHGGDGAYYILLRRKREG